MRQHSSTASDKSTKPEKIVNVSEEQEIQIFAKQMLSKRLFVGHYQERRYVQPLNSYRDIVRVSGVENDLAKDLIIVKKRILPFYPPHQVWTGVTGPDLPGAPAGVCLWVKLSDLPFGQYWFQIREVKFVENEIFLRLKCVRSYTPEGGSLTSLLFSKSSVSSSDTQENTKESIPGNNLNFNLQNSLSSLMNINYNELCVSWWCSVKQSLTVYNVREVSKFVFILLISAIAGLANFIMYVGDFSLKLIHELSGLIRACTPVFLGIMDFFTKCVGGLYILIAMIWRGSPPPNYPNQKPSRHLAIRNFPHNPPVHNFKQPNRTKKHWD